MTYPIAEVDRVRGGSKIAAFITEDGTQYSLQATPEEASLSGVGGQWEVIERQGQKPLTRYAGALNRKLQLDHTIHDALVQFGTATNAINVLLGLADANPPRKVRIVNMTSDIETRGWWIIESLALSIRTRLASQEIESADLSWQLTEHVDARPEVSKVPPPPPPPAPPASASSGSITGGTEYTVKKGDSLWAIASRLLGSGPRWRELYDQNKDRLGWTAPEMYRNLLTVWIYPGQVIKVPPK